MTLPTAIYTNIDLPSFDPMLDRTNAQDRFLLKGSVRVANGFSPELLLYHAGDRTQVGGNFDVGDQPADHRLCGVGGRSRAPA